MTLPNRSPPFLRCNKLFYIFKKYIITQLQNHVYNIFTGNEAKVRSNRQPRYSCKGAHVTGSTLHKEFDSLQMITVNQAVDVAEEMVSNFYKLSDSQMRQLNYDIKTASQLAPHEIVKAHFAQIVRYRAQKKGSLLETDAKDFYLICLQDQAILSAIKKFGQLPLYPFMLYVVCHELIHVVRFRRFLQHFHVSPEERQLEEIRVHHATREILKPASISGLDSVFEFYHKWQEAFERMDEIVADHDDAT